MGTLAHSLDPPTHPANPPNQRSPLREGSVRVVTQ